MKDTNQKWAFTYKKLGKTSADDNYDLVKKHLNTYGLVMKSFIELDSLGKPHIHGTVLLRRGMLRKNLRVQGYNMHLSQLTTDLEEQAWDNYITKDTNPNNVYMF